MRLLITAVGKLKRGPQAALVEDYTGRIHQIGKATGFTDFSIVEVEAPKALDGKARQQKEASLLEDALAPVTKRIVLDERGKSLSSAALAQKLGTWRDEGTKMTGFVIGGADGHDKKITDRADLLLSFGAATWPHMLARAMLCEQIYRAMTILSNHPYHRE